MREQSRRLAGRYELGEIIGRGGMGTVYRATDLVLDRTVAVKLLPAALAEEDDRHIARFEREARAAASLANPSVVAVYDTGEDEATRFIVMECVKGRSLAAVLHDDAPLRPVRAARIASRVADALAAAHAAGIVHRDVKPGNVMLAGDGAVKVLDFGIARSSDASALTQSTSVLGTAGYLAPEQALGERADERSDIYSLGCLLYALLTGRPPFTGEAPAAVLHQHVNSEPKPPSTLNGEVSPELDAIVMDMLAKSPDARPQSATQVRDALTGAAASEDAPTASTARLEPTARTHVLAQAAPARRRSRLGAAAALTAAVLLIVAIVVLASGGSGRGGTPATHAAKASKGTVATAAAARTPSRPPTHTAASAPAQTTPAPAPAKTTPVPESTVAGAASALSSLVAQDVQSGAIDPASAGQITSGVADALSAFEAGRAFDAQRKVLKVSERVARAGERGQISPATASSLAAGLTTLGAALGKSTPPTAPSQSGPAEPPAAEGHDGEEPPKGHGRHGDGHREGGGN